MPSQSAGGTWAPSSHLALHILAGARVGVEEEEQAGRRGGLGGPTRGNARWTGQHRPKRATGRFPGKSGLPANPGPAGRPGTTPAAGGRAGPPHPTRAPARRPRDRSVTFLLHHGNPLVRRAPRSVPGGSSTLHGGAGAGAGPAPTRPAAGCFSKSPPPAGSPHARRCPPRRRRRRRAPRAPGTLPLRPAARAPAAAARQMQNSALLSSGHRHRHRAFLAPGPPEAGPRPGWGGGWSGTPPAA